MRARDRAQLQLVAGAAGVLALALGFVVVAGLVTGGSTRHFDEWLMASLRQAHDPSDMIGPRWLEGAALDLTALGGWVVLGLTVLAVTGYLLLHGLRRNALFVFAASAGGWMLNWALKAAFDRARPDIVPHLREVMTSSFPSGHAMTSAAVYLTLGVLLMRIAEGRLARYYCLAMALLVTFLVGASRVVLGVHYPSDVLAGWLAGTCWALFCLVVELRVERNAGLRQERLEAARQ
jgi:undecaprenyl-diphosphatase